MVISRRSFEGTAKKLKEKLDAHAVLLIKPIEILNVLVAFATEFCKVPIKQP